MSQSTSLPEIVGIDYDPIRLEMALEEADDFHLLCWCGEAFTYVSNRGCYVCDAGHITNDPSDPFNLWGEQ